MPASVQSNVSQTRLSPGVVSWHRQLLDLFRRRISFCYVGPTHEASGSGEHLTPTRDQF